MPLQRARFVKYVVDQAVGRHQHERNVLIDQKDLPGYPRKARETHRRVCPLCYLLPVTMQGKRQPDSKVTCEMHQRQPRPRLCPRRGA